ncbi:MAG: restriction endonuclease [Lutibacter sp.]
MITDKIPETWQNLQTEIGSILEKCGFVVEIEKTVDTVRGQAEIDVYAEENIKGRKYSIICECKHWKANIPQNVIHGFRTIISDLGCNIGYIITTSDFQSGAKKASELTNIQLMTWNDFQSNFFESWFYEYFSPKISKDLDALLTYIEPILPKWFEKMTDEDKSAYFILKDKYNVFGWIVMMFTPYAEISRKGEIPKLPLNKAKFDDLIPDNILNATTYKEFLENCIEYGNKAISEFRVYRDKYNPTE